MNPFGCDSHLDFNLDLRQLAGKAELGSGCSAQVLAKCLILLYKKTGGFIDIVILQMGLLGTKKTKKQQATNDSYFFFMFFVCKICTDGAVTCSEGRQSPTCQS